jgi:hypothetical protein
MQSAPAVGQLVSPKKALLFVEPGPMRPGFPFPAPPAKINQLNFDCERGQSLRVAADA